LTAKIGGLLFFAYLRGSTLKALGRGEFLSKTRRARKPLIYTKIRGQFIKQKISEKMVLIKQKDLYHHFDKRQIL
jgi:hypothetical protein